MATSSLVVRIESNSAIGQMVPVSPEYRSLASLWIGDGFVLATWDGEGWECLAFARLAGIVSRSRLTFLKFRDVQVFERPVRGQRPEGSAEPEPLEELSPEGARLLRKLAFVRQPALAGSALEEGMTVYAHGAGVDARALPDHEKWVDLALGAGTPLHAAAVSRYAFTCGISHLPLVRAGTTREGFVVPVSPFTLPQPTQVKEVLVLSGTFAFCYVHGLITVSAGLALNLHPGLPTERRGILEDLNPMLRLHVPADPEDWPDPMLLAEHRRAFGID